MSQVIVNIEFTEMKKNKKESLKFTLKGDDSKGTGKLLYDMAGSIVHMEIKGCAVGKFPAEFVDIKKSAKGVVANFLLKGDLSDEQSGWIYAYSGGNSVELTIEESQMSIEDFHDDEHEGIGYGVNPDGTVQVDENQLSIDDIVEQNAGMDESDPMADVDKEPANEIEDRKARKAAAKAKKAEAEQAKLDAEPSKVETLDDEELPF